MPTHEDRRAAVEDLAVSVRALADAAAETAVAPGEVRAIGKAVRALITRLTRAVDEGPYSGLVQPPVDYSVPEGPMPLNPIIGACSPTRPDVHLRYVDGHVDGTATFTKRFVGPPGFTH